ncbi:MAG: DNA adenine methylase [Candidatus Poribacteria bacterium]|nr:DNA adenine methylase [Candidatus Poribacteria bacterium]
MRYIGCKNNLLPHIEEVISHQGVQNGVLCDIFAGTHAVAAHFKKIGFQIISNDLLFLAYVFGRALIQNNRKPTFYGLIDLPQTNAPSGLFDRVDPYLKVLNYLNQLDGVKDGFVFNAYCPGGINKYRRQYISDSNGQKIDAIRGQIEAWKANGAITDDEYYLLLLPLLEAVSRVTNISGTYGAYLKTWDARTYKTLTLEPIAWIPSEKEHTAYREDANHLIGRIECDVLYIDPPYNTRQYITNYHLLETIARYDNPDVYGKTGLRPYSDEEKSAYCSKTACMNAFPDLISKARAKHIVMSYNSEGIMTETEILNVLGQRGSNPKIYPIDYRRFKSNSNGAKKNKKKVQEYLFYVKVN